MIWHLRASRGATADMLGYIPEMLSDDDPRPAREQFDAAYGHGGGWLPLVGGRILPDESLSFPPEPHRFELLGSTVLHAWTHETEEIRFYRGAFVAIVQADGSFEVCRMD